MYIFTHTLATIIVPPLL